jgi:hypothetical protein
VQDAGLANLRPPRVSFHVMLRNQRRSKKSLDRSGKEYNVEMWINKPSALQPTGAGLAHGTWQAYPHFLLSECSVLRFTFYCLAGRNGIVTAEEIDVDIFTASNVLRPHV